MNIKNKTNNNNTTNNKKNMKNNMRNIMITNNSNFKLLLKKMPYKANQRNLLIFSPKYQVEFEKFKNKYNLNNCMQTLNLISTTLYYGRVYNPPYFDNIIVIRPTNDEETKKIWNMTYENGYFIISQEYEKLFKNYVIDKISNYILVHKKSNFVYQFPKWKVIDFMIAGTMKGGTTSAMRNFYNHPDISMPNTEYDIFKGTYGEVHYFNDIRGNYLKGLEWYRQHFNYSKKIIGDKCPDIMYQHLCLDLLQIVNPQVKIILFLRNPIDRAYSHWKMLKNDFSEYMQSFENSVNDELEHRMGEIRNYDVSFWSHIVQRGFYYEQIMNILRYFPKMNIYISISEKVRHNMNEEYNKIFKFIGASPYKGEFKEEYTSKSKNSLDPKSDIYKKLMGIYNDDKVKLEEFLGYKTGWW